MLARDMVRVMKPTELTKNISYSVRIWSSDVQLDFCCRKQSGIFPKLYPGDFRSGETLPTNLANPYYWFHLDKQNSFEI